MAKQLTEKKTKKVEEPVSDSEEYESDQEEESSSGDEEENENEKDQKREREEEEKEEEEEKVPVKKVKIERIEKKKFGAEGTTVFVGQLNFDATAEEIRTHFGQCGPVSDVRLRMHPNGVKSRGFAHIDFTSAEGKQAAMALDGTEFMGRTIRVDDAQPAQGRSTDTNYGPKTDKVFVANLSYDTDEDSLKQAFEKFGTIVGEIGLPISRDTGRIRGIAYIQFETEDEAEAAVKGMNGVYLDGRPIRTDFSGDNDRNRLGERPARQRFADRFAGRGAKKQQRGKFGKRGGSRM